MTYANSLDPDQDWQNVGPELDPKPFETLIVFLKEFFKKKVTLKRQEINASENVVCWSCLLQIIA